jgi:hypothetical protein
MKLIECATLINIEGTVYKLSQKDYLAFKSEVFSASKDLLTSSHRINLPDDNNRWSNLLHWVEDHGTKICTVESYNF